jgi:hypothetical protein
MKHMFALFSTLLFSVAVFSATEYTTTFGPKKYTTKEKYSENFVGVDKQINKIIVTNGSGKDLVKKVCSEKPLEKLLCIAGNLLIDLKINLERVASVEISLNGKKIVTPQDFNIKTRQIILEVPVLKNNTLSISPRGIFTSYITVEVQAPKDTTSPIADLKIDSFPVSQITQISLTGTAIGNIDAIRAINNIGEGYSVGLIKDDKTFSVPHYMLSEGSNSITIEALYKGTVVSTKIIPVILNTPAAGKNQMSPENGAIVEVTDATSSLIGAKMSVPPGAAERPFYVSIDDGAENMLDLPFGYVSVGPAVTFYPIWAEFLSNVTITLPFSNELIPIPATKDNIVIFAKSTQIEELEMLTPSMKNLNDVEYSFSGKNFWTSLVPAVKMPLRPGHLRVITNPPGAEIALDGYKTEYISNALMTNISQGPHSLKVYKPGYNETIVNFPVSANGREVVVNLKESGDNKPVVEINPDILSETIHYEDEFTFYGQVRFPSSFQFATGVASYNNKEIRFKIEEDGSFESSIDLVDDVTSLQLRVTVGGSDTGLSRIVTITKQAYDVFGKSLALMQTESPQTKKFNISSKRFDVNKLMNSKPIHAKSISLASGAKMASNVQLLSEDYESQGKEGEPIEISISWASNLKDIDLIVQDPENNVTTFNEYPYGIPNSTIKQSTTSAGQEKFQLNKAIPGEYRIWISHPEGTNPNPDRYGGRVGVTLTAKVGNRTMISEFHELNIGDFAGYWYLIIDDSQIKIVEIKADGIKLKDGEVGSFTTDSLISIITESQNPDFDSRINYLARQITTLNPYVGPTNPNPTVVKTDIKLTPKGKAISVKLPNAYLKNLTTQEKEVYWRNFSEPLKYEIVACIDECNEFSSIASPVFYITQDSRGQIKQEYFDKKSFKPFSILPPLDNQLLSEKDYIRDFFEISKFTKYKQINIKNDFIPINAVMAKNSPKIIDWFKNFKPTIDENSAAAHTSIYVSSVWRNPRRNDRIGGAVNSDHQEGNSVDFGQTYLETAEAPTQEIKPEHLFLYYQSSRFLQACSALGYEKFDVLDRGLKCSSGNDFLINEDDHIHASDN